MTEPSASREVARWQRRLMPFMTAALVLLAFFVFWQLERTRPPPEHGRMLGPAIEAVFDKAKFEPSADQLVMRSLVVLEAEAMERRYGQANALLQSRISARQLAFITGMVLAFLGAVFILGKMSETGSTIDGGGAGFKASISSSSPGIVLAFFGTVVLIVSMVIQTTIEVKDSPVYVMTLGMKPAQAQGTELIESTHKKAIDVLDELSGKPEVPGKEAGK
jgi:hypothetical protein